MKRLVLSLALVFAATVAFSQPPTTASTPTMSGATVSNPNPKAPEISFKEEFYDFGTVKYDAKVNHDYVFTNTGKEPLIISKVDKQCGCTTPVFSPEPVAPGKTGKVSISFDTKRVGTHEKTITVISNAKTASKTLKFKITVAPQENTGAPVNNTGPKAN